jgi:histone acetyltransferase (RNA polymerase elongator complex component)
LTHNSLKKEFKLDETKAQKLYSRLYWDYTLFDSVEDFIEHWKLENVFELSEEINTQIKTYIIWQTPDITSYREFVSLDTRSREIRNKPQSDKAKSQKPNLIIRQYFSSVWVEYFLSFEDLQWYLYGFARLLLPQKWNTIDREWLWHNTALIRELHVYGQLASLKSDIYSDQKKQHKWFGTQLMNVAGQISKQAWFQRLSVISGVWVRWYYAKLWYSLEWTYMIKKI